jgi:hypothetical protein
MFGGGALTDENDPGCGGRGHGGNRRVVGVEDGDTAGRQGRDELGLGAGDVVPATELADVRLPHVEDDPDARWRDPGEVGDVADPPRPHLGDEEAGGRGDSADRQRDADLAVVGAFGGHGLGAGAQDLGEQVLGRGLPGRPRDPDDGEVGGSVDDGPCDGAEGRLYVVG